MQTPFLVEQLARCCIYMTPDGRQKRPPRDIAETIQARGEWPTLRRLSGVVLHPFLRPDGSVCSTPGFDAATALLLKPIGGPFPGIPPEPTKEQAYEALGELRELLREFPCENDYDQSVLFSAYMLVAARRALPVAPLIGIDSAEAGSGKTTAARGISILADCSQGAVFALPHEDEAELHKLVESALLSGESCLIFDNISGPLRSETLCAAATSPEFQFRILGRSEVAKVPNAAIVVLTGLNLAPLGDLAQRVLVARLDPNMPRPDLRRFEIVDFAQHVRKKRAAIISSCLVVTRAYLAAGAPDLQCEPWARFPQFDQFIRRPLLWLGEADPLESVERARRADPDRHELLDLLDAIGALPNAADFSTRDLIEHATELPASPLASAARAVASDAAGKVNPKRLGRYLLRHAGRIVERWRLVRRTPTGGSARWAVMVSKV